MLKQIVFLKKRDDMTMKQFMEYHENHHSQLAKKMGATPSLPNAQRYVRRLHVIETATHVGSFGGPESEYRTNEVRRLVNAHWRRAG
jgi:hypothetical protein